MAGLTDGAEVAHPRAYRVIGGAELFGRGLERLAFDEDSTQGHVAAMRWLDGLQEEAATGCVVHDRHSVLRVIFAAVGTGYGRLN